MASVHASSYSDDRPGGGGIEVRRSGAQHTRLVVDVGYASLYLDEDEARQLAADLTRVLDGADA